MDTDMCMIKFILCQHVYKEDNYRKYKSMTTRGCTWKGSFDLISAESKTQLTEVQPKDETSILTCYEFKYISAKDDDVNMSIGHTKIVLKKGYSALLWADDVTTDGYSPIRVYSHSPRHGSKQWGVKHHKSGNNSSVMLDTTLCISGGMHLIRVKQHLTCNTFIYNENGAYKCDVCVIMRDGVRTIKYHLHCHVRGVLRLARIMKTCNFRRSSNVMGNISTFTVNCNLYTI